MVVAENIKQLMKFQKFKIVNEILFEGLKFSFINENEGVQRGKNENLTSITFRNEEERMNLILFFNGELMEFAEAYYCVN